MRKLVTVSALAVIASACSAQAYIHLTLHGDPGEYVSGGKDSDVTYTAANSSLFGAQLSDFSGLGVPNYLQLSALLNNANPDEYLLAFFGTNKIPAPMQPGTYLNAQRAPFASAGHPGLDVSFEHRGNNTVSGNFTINSFAYHKSGSNFVLDYFDASFLQYSEAGPKSCWGTLTYNAVPEPSSYLTMGIGLLAAIGAKRSRRRSR